MSLKKIALACSLSVGLCLGADQLAGAVTTTGAGAVSGIALGVALVDSNPVLGAAFGLTTGGSVGFGLGLSYSPHSEGPKDEWLLLDSVQAQKLKAP